MGIFKALVRTVVNVAALPITLPVAIVKESLDYASAIDHDNHVKKVIDQLKEEADTDD